MVGVRCMQQAVNQAHQGKTQPINEESIPQRQFSWEREEISTPRVPVETELHTPDSQEIEKLKAVVSAPVSAEIAELKWQEAKSSVVGEMRDLRAHYVFRRAIYAACGVAATVGIGFLAHSIGMGIKESAAALGAVALLGIGVAVCFGASEGGDSQDGGKALGGVLTGTFLLGRYAFIKGAGFLGLGSVLGAAAGVVGTGFLVKNVIKEASVDFERDSSELQEAHRHFSSGNYQESANALKKALHNDYRGYYALSAAALMKVVGKNIPEPLVRVAEMRRFLDELEGCSRELPRKKILRSRAVFDLCGALKNEAQGVQGEGADQEKEAAAIVLSKISEHWSSEMRKEFEALTLAKPAALPRRSKDIPLRDRRSL